MLEIMKKEIQVTIQYSEGSSNNEVKGERCISQGIEAEKESSHVPSLSPSRLGKYNLSHTFFSQCYVDRSLELGCVMVTS